MNNGGTTYSKLKSIFPSLRTAPQNLRVPLPLYSIPITQILKSDLGSLPSVREYRIQWNLVVEEFVQLDGCCVDESHFGQLTRSGVWISMRGCSLAVLIRVVIGFGLTLEGKLKVISRVDVKEAA